MFELPYGMDFLWWLANLFPGAWRSRGWGRLPSPWSWTSVPLTVFWLCSWCLTHPFFLSASRCLLPQTTSPRHTRPPPRWSRSSPTYNCMKGGTISRYYHYRKQSFASSYRNLHTILLIILIFWPKRFCRHLSSEFLLILIEAKNLLTFFYVVGIRKLEVIGTYTG